MRCELPFTENFCCTNFFQKHVTLFHFILIVIMKATIAQYCFQEVNL